MVYTGCDKCKYDSKRTDEYPCNECIHGASVKEHFKPMTNAERIRNMSDEELAEMLHNIGSYAEDGEPKIDIWLGEDMSVLSDDYGNILEWLQAEVKEGGEDECN